MSLTSKQRAALRGMVKEIEFLRQEQMRLRHY